MAIIANSKSALDVAATAADVATSVTQVCTQVWLALMQKVCAETTVVYVLPISLRVALAALPAS